MQTIFKIIQFSPNLALYYIKFFGDDVFSQMTVEGPIACEKMLYLELNVENLQCNAIYYKPPAFLCSSKIILYFNECIKFSSIFNKKSNSASLQDPLQQ